MKTSILCLSLLSLLPAHAQFGDFPAADLALGASAPDSLGNTNNGGGFQSPRGIAFDSGSGKLFVADSTRNRILRFANVSALANGDAAEAVIGQADFDTFTPGLTNATLDSPIGIHTDGAGNLWVADFGNNRVLRFPNAATAGNGPTADIVLGQVDFTSETTGTTGTSMNAPNSVFSDSLGNLWVSETGNNRVLRFANAGSLTSGASASGVIGETSFGVGVAGLAGSIDNPSGIAVDAAGTLWVCDLFGNRILRFDDAAAKANGADADGVLGQGGLSSLAPGLDQDSLNTPNGIGLSGDGTLFVIDSSNHRVLVFRNAASKPNGAPADEVIGQPNFTSNAIGFTEKNLKSPSSGLAVDGAGNLWVSDSGNFRVLRYSKDSIAPTVTITSKFPRKTASARLTLRGTASDDKQLAKVEFRVGNGAFRNTNGTASWSATAKLKKGRNTIQVKATDSAGNLSALRSVRTKRETK